MSKYRLTYTDLLAQEAQQRRRGKINESARRAEWIITVIGAFAITALLLGVL